MKRMQIIGLALVAVFAMSAVVASAASAAPEWHECTTTGTETTTHCPSGSKGSKLTAAIAVDSEGRLTLTNATLGVTVRCPKNTETPGIDKGFVGPGNKDEITSITSETGVAAVPCEVVAGESLCGKTATATAIGLPWKTELVTGTGTEIRDNITTSAAGYKIKCESGATSECKGTTSTKATNVLTASLAEVALEFEAKSAEAKCTPLGTGKITGTDTIVSFPAGVTGVYVE
jgi:hypothetical protein